MKCTIPEISYHNRDPVLSVDFQPPQAGQPVRLATAGSDTLDCLSDLTRHQRAVNIVRWSPDGQLLASGDDESVIIVWKMREGAGEGGGLFDEGGENKENWVVYKMIRFHLDDIYDLSWSPCSQLLLSGSVDNTAIVTNVHKNKKVSHLSDSRGFVQGVAWNRKHDLLSTVGSDRNCRSYNSSSMKLLSKTYKCTLNMDYGKKKTVTKKKKESVKTDENKPEEKAIEDTGDDKKEEEEQMTVGDAAKPDDSSGKKKDVDKSVRLFHDDTFKGFFRRLSWSNDGELLVVPSGVIETDGEAGTVTHCTWVFTRLNLAKPVLCLPTKDKYTIAVKFHPKKFALRRSKRAAPASPHPEWVQTGSIFALPYRMVYAVATQNAVMFYDTQQATPFGRVSNIHYTGLTDLTWSPCGNILVVSSSDGFCSIVTFEAGELGEELAPSALPSAAASPVPPSPSLATSPSLKTTNRTTSTSPTTANPTTKSTNPTTTTTTTSSPTTTTSTSPTIVPTVSQLQLDSPASSKTQAPGKAGPKRLSFITLSSPKAEKKEKVKRKEKKAGAATGLVFEEALQEAPGVGEQGDGGLGVELMEVESSEHLSLVLEESQSALEPPAPAPAPEGKKRVPLTSLPTSLSAKPRPSTPEKKVGRRVNLITLSSPKTKQ